MSGELTCPELSGVGQSIMIAIIMRWFFPIGVFHRKSLCQSYDVARLIYFIPHIIIYVYLTLKIGIKALGA